MVSLWHDLTVRLTLLHITSEHYAIEPLVALGLKPDSSKNKKKRIKKSCNRNNNNGNDNDKDKAIFSSNGKQRF